MNFLLTQTIIYLLAAVIAVPIASRLGLGSVLGYLVAGIFIGPLFGLVGSETEDIQHFAEFGVVMMLFLIGLELAPRTLWDMRRKIIGLGGIQVAGTTAAIAGILIWFDFDLSTAIAIGMIFALSSTAIVLQTLTEKALMQSNGGRSAFAVLLTQDIAVIPMLAVLPFLAVPLGADLLTQHSDPSHGGHAATLLGGLPPWLAGFVVICIFGFIITAGIFLTRPVFKFIHYARLREMYTALALLIVIGIAVLMQSIGISPALGTFLAGVVLANSEFRHELHSDIEPFKGLLLGLFFITVGAGIDFGVLIAEPAIILGLTFALILIKAAILFILSLVFRIRGQSRWLFTLSLAQAGEFGFVLIAFSTQQSVIDGATGDRLLLIVALSMLITPLLFLIYEALARRLPDAPMAADDTFDITTQAPVIIAGIGRFGQIVNRLVRNSGVKTVLIGHDFNTLQVMRRFGFKGYFGDPMRSEVLAAAGIDQARVLVAALDDPVKNTALVRFARRQHPDLHIIARAFDRHHVFELHHAGADDIVRETFDSSLRAGRYVLENTGLTEFEAAEAEKTFFQHDRKTMRALTKVWTHDTQPFDNEDYISLAKELEQELEASLLGQLSLWREDKTSPSQEEDTQPAATPASAKVDMPE